MLELNTNLPEKFFIFWLICILQSLSGNSLGLLLGSYFSDPRVASALSPVLFIPFMLFSGYYRNRGKYLSFLE